MLVDNEHQCQLFYRSPPLPHLLSLSTSTHGPEPRDDPPRARRNPVSPDAKRPRVVRPVALEVLIATGRPRPWHPSSAYIADAPGGAGSTSRIRPSSGTREV